MLLDTISLISLVAIISMLRKIIAAFPAVMLCIVRWKENINIEENVKLSRDRDLIAMALALPFCLIVNRLGLISFRFANGFSPEASFAVTLGIFALYCIFRLFTAKVFLPRKKMRGANRAACNCDRTYFIILTALLLCAWWILGITGPDQAFIRKTMLWISAATYMLMIIRKFQIFQSYHSIFTAFLYLCALEIIPTVTLVVSVIIF